MERNNWNHPRDNFSFLRALGLFARPKSTIGSIVMTLSVCLALVPEDQLHNVLIDIIFFTSAVTFWTIAGHGVNQIYDLAVDKVNKPHFPLPSGHLSIKEAWILSIGAGVIGSFFSILTLPFPTNVTFIVGVTIAIFIYSMPFFKVRNSAWLPKFMGISIRGVLFPIVSYIGAQEISRQDYIHIEHLIFIIIFSILFCIGMNTFEDIQDMEGDRLYGYESIAQRIGPVPTAYICLGAFFLAYVVLVLWQISSPQLFSVSLGVVTSTAMLTLFCFRFRLLVPQLRHDIAVAKPFYRFLWQLYCVQYLLLPVLFRHP